MVIFKSNYLKYIIYYVLYFTPFNISNADFLGIKKIKKCKINRRAYSYEVVS